jgi:hypothetical protein
MARKRFFWKMIFENLYDWMKKFRPTWLFNFDLNISAIPCFGFSGVFNSGSSLLLLHVLEQHKSCHNSILFSFPKGWISPNFSFKTLRNFFSSHVFLISKQNNLPAVNFPQPQNKLNTKDYFRVTYWLVSWMWRRNYVHDLLVKWRNTLIGLKLRVICSRNCNRVLLQSVLTKFLRLK